MTDKVGRKDGVTPLGELDADSLEGPADVVAVTVGHENGGFDGLVWV